MKRTRQQQTQKKIQTQKITQTQLKKPNINKEIIGQGAYGCVYSPPIRCLDPCKDDRCFMGVSKLILKENAKIELSESKRIDEIDPSYKFHLKQPYLCKRPDFRGYTTSIPTCKTDKDNIPLDESVLLYYKKHGMDLFKFLTSYERNHIDIDLNKFLVGFSNIFRGIRELTANKYTHSDLKLANILIKDYKFMIADFGISVDYMKSNRRLNSENFKYKLSVYSGDDYVIWPPEIFMINNPIDTVKKDMFVSKFNKKMSVYSMWSLQGMLVKICYMVDIFYQKSKSKSLDLLKIHINSTINRNNDKLNYENIYNKFRTRNDRTNPTQQMEKIFEKIDVFSVGILLGQCIISLHKKIFDTPDIVIEALVTIIIKMTDIDMYERISPEKACQMWENFITKIYKTNI